MADVDPEDNVDEVQEDSPEVKEVREMANKETAKLRRKAIIAGVSIVTQGACQDVFYGILNVISSLLVAAQFMMNLYSTFAKGVGCNQAGTFTAAQLWFYTQLVLNGIATVGQLYVWGYSGFYSCKFCCGEATNGKFPTSQFASSSDYRATYMAMRVQEMKKEYEEEWGQDWDALDDDEKDEKFSEFHELIQSEGVPLDFKDNMKGLAFAAGLQAYLTTFRAFVGAAGTILEPTLSASAAWSAYQKTTSTAVVTTKVGTTLRLLAETTESAVEKCFAVRQMSAAGSGVIAAIGIQQERIKSAYTKLVTLSNLRQNKIDELSRSRQPGNTKAMEKYDAAIEKEVLDAVGPTGQKVVQLMSGHTS
eukprot:CAMPEP_0169111974 /NCGR_PEP_ID=MMETSP1015-20121227/27375_1 /TAXON_ID=342587 /ORGANISM="Karlodinium micrum, Strain CCMP2283" /LENGTH=362 /DNA_ID=CAMNT_0009173955 /DNA_START=45 /DNA_END=1133 /DNA_ORIENTATION=+